MKPRDVRKYPYWGSLCIRKQSYSVCTPCSRLSFSRPTPQRAANVVLSISRGGHIIIACTRLVSFGKLTVRSLREVIEEFGARQASALQFRVERGVDSSEPNGRERQSIEMCAICICPPATQHFHSGAYLYGRDCPSTVHVHYGAEWVGGGIFMLFSEG